MDRLDALRIFIEVVGAGSFSAVARERGIVTSTVTAAIGQLEQEACAQLMVRTTRRLVLTHEGAMLLADARRIVAEWDAAMSGLRQDGPLAGPVRVTATNDFGRVQLRPLLDAFQARHPAIHITLLLSDDAVDLIDQRVDLALRSGPLPDSGLRARLLVRGRRLVCASPAYWRRCGIPAHPAALTAHNCLVLMRPGAPLSSWPFQEGERQVSVKVSGDRQASAGDVLRAWAIAGLGVALKNDWDIHAERAEGTLVTVLDDYATGGVDLYAVQSGGPPSRRVAALVDFLAEAMATRPGPPAAGVRADGM